MECPPSNIEAIAESDRVEFKAQFDPKSRQDWCELIKDIVAVANSGGGTILIGVDDDGAPSGFDVSSVLSIDVADVTNKIHSYTEQQSPACQITEREHRGHRIALLEIASARIPLVFTSPGTYPVGPTAQKTAFARGTLYFRHGPKSEPATSADLAAVIDRELARVKEFWLAGIAKVVAAPTDATIHVVSQPVALSELSNAAPVRLTTDQDAPTFKALQADKLYPYRQTELIKKLRVSLGPAAIGAHDLLCVRRVYRTDEELNFSHKSQWSPRQYSDAFLDWLLAQHAADSGFFQKARDAYKNPSGGLLSS